MFGAPAAGGGLFRAATAPTAGGGNLFGAGVAPAPAAAGGAGSLFGGGAPAAAFGGAAAEDPMTPTSKLRAGDKHIGQMSPVVQSWAMARTPPQTPIGQSQTEPSDRESE